MNIEQLILTAIITTYHTSDDPDVLIINQQPYFIDYIDLLILLIWLTESHAQELYWKKIGRGNVSTQVHLYKSFDKYPQYK